MAGRICAGAVSALFVCSMSAWAQTGSSRSEGGASLAAVNPAVTAATARPSANAAVALLRRRVESVDWLDQPFEEVITWLKDNGEGQVNVVPRWGPLSVESVDRDTLVTLQLNNTTVGQVLNETMDQLSEDGEVTFRGVGNTLKISTKADFGRKMYVRIYDATDILFRVPNFGRTAPIIDLQRTGGRGGAGGGGGGGQSVFSGSGSGSQQEEAGEQAEQELQERLEELRTLIEETIVPDSWDTADVGGPGRIRVFNRSLVVYNTIEVHEMIAGGFVFGE